MKNFLRVSILVSFFILANTFSSNAQVIVKVKPLRPKIIVVKPARVKAKHTWVAGHWRWNKRSGKYVWVKGHHVKNRRGFAYVPGHWRAAPKGHKWVPGHWKKR